MALSIAVPDEAWSSQTVSLGGLTYTFTFRYNGRDNRWRLDISLGDQVIKNGITLIENQFLLGRYSIDNFSHGDLAVLRIKKDGLPAGRNNLGIDKAYEIRYYTNSEILKIASGNI